MPQRTCGFHEITDKELKVILRKVIWSVLKCFWSSLLTRIRAGSQILENRVVYQNWLFHVFFG
jgi:surface polysaccharide O-acyltransferase-like enzyme